MDERNCVICSAPFPKSGRRAVCSDSCFAERARWRARAWYQRHRGTDRVKDTMDRASKAYRARLRLEPERLAESYARSASARRAARDKIREQERRWREANPGRARGKVQRRRARLALAETEDFDFALVWDRDAGICGICADPIDIAVKYPDPASLSLDHVVPLSRGGSHALANVQLAHMGCNSRKGNRPSTTLLRQNGYIR